MCRRKEIITGVEGTEEVETEEIEVQDTIEETTTEEEEEITTKAGKEAIVGETEMMITEEEGTTIKRHRFSFKEIKKKESKQEIRTPGKARTIKRVRILLLARSGKWMVMLGNLRRKSLSTLS
jgi:hypothetical protein